MLTRLIIKTILWMIRVPLIGALYPTHRGRTLVGKGQLNVHRCVTTLIGDESHHNVPIYGNKVANDTFNGVKRH